MFQRNFHIIFLIFLASTNSFAQTKTLSKSDSIQIITETFKSLFKDNASYKKSNVDVYYIEFSDSAMTIKIEEIVNVLNGILPKVKDAKIHKSLSKNEQTKIKYLFFNVGKISVTTSNKKVQVDCGYYEGPLSASINKAVLRKKWGKWRLVTNDIIIIS